MSENSTRRDRNQPVGLNPDHDESVRRAAGASDLERAGGPGPRSWLAPRRRGGAVPTGISAISVLAGAWLVLAPFALGSSLTGLDAEARMNDVVVGIAIAVIAIVRMVAPYRTAWLGSINVILGAWLVVAPFALGHGGFARWNDVIVGVVVVVVALLSGVLALRRPAENERSTPTA
jgi:hypothetical protein